jgi:hypothetical protein
LKPDLFEQNSIIDKVTAEIIIRTIPVINKAVSVLA